jgi:hypothetical protein
MGAGPIAVPIRQWREIPQFLWQKEGNDSTGLAIPRWNFQGMEIGTGNH